MATEKQVSIEQFRAHLQAEPKGRRIDEVVVHHTWRPAASDYRGIETVRAVRRYHVETRGWQDNGYHVMFGPDAAIFLCRPIQTMGAHTEGRNGHTVGVSFIANFDSDDPTGYGGMQAGLLATAELLKRFDLGPENIRFHREFAQKTCPGIKLGLDSYRAEVKRMMSPQVRLRVNGTELSSEAVDLTDGVTMVRVRDFTEAAGGTLAYDPATKVITVKTR